MAIWRIVTMERTSDDGYVFTAHWEATDKSARAYGSVGLERPDVLIPYESLTEQTCIEWVKEKLDVEQIEASLKQQAEELENPLTAVGLPW